MVITLRCETPDIIFNAVEDIQDDDMKEQAVDACRKYVKYDEYVTIDVDTDTGVATVRPVK